MGGTGELYMIEVAGSSLKGPTLSRKGIGLDGTSPVERRSNAVQFSVEMHGLGRPCYGGKPDVERRSNAVWFSVEMRGLGRPRYGGSESEGSESGEVRRTQGSREGRETEGRRRGSVCSAKVRYLGANSNLTSGWPSGAWRRKVPVLRTLPTRAQALTMSRQAARSLFFLPACMSMMRV